MDAYLKCNINEIKEHTNIIYKTSMLAYDRVFFVTFVVVTMLYVITIFTLCGLG